MTILAVVKDVCAAVGVMLPTSVFSGLQSNRTMQEMLSLANEMAQRIAYDTREWTTLRRMASFTNTIAPWAPSTSYLVKNPATDPADGSTWGALAAHTSGSGTFAEDRAANPSYWESLTQLSFLLPADFKRMLLTANVRASTSPTQPLQFIPDYDEWVEARLSGTSSSSFGEWTIAAGLLWVSPPPRAATATAPATTITMPYLDRNCVTLTSGGFGDVFMADTDSFRLDERLLKLGMIWQWMANKGSPYAEPMGTYSDALANAMGHDSPAPIIIGRKPMSANARVAYPWPVPT